MGSTEPIGASAAPGPSDRRGVAQALLRPKQLSEGQPDKWEVVSNQIMDDFVANGCELEPVA
jgi:hypothetical protein